MSISSRRTSSITHWGQAGRTGRSLPGLGVSISAVKLWARSFGWQARIQERDADSARHLADRSLQSGPEERVKQHKIVQLAMMRLAKAIAEGKVRMQLGDLDRLIRLSAFLEGYDESKGFGKTPEEIADFLNMIPTQTFEKVVEIINRRNGGLEDGADRR